MSTPIRTIRMLGLLQGLSRMRKQQVRRGTVSINRMCCTVLSYFIQGGPSKQSNCLLEVCLPLAQEVCFYILHYFDTISYRLPKVVLHHRKAKRNLMRATGHPNMSSALHILPQAMNQCSKRAVHIASRRSLQELVKASGLSSTSKFALFAILGCI